MREAWRANPRKTPPTYTDQEGAPVKGWMSKSSVAEADPLSAVIMENVFPEAEAVRSRRGYTLHATVSGNVYSLLRYVNDDSINRLFAATDTTIYNVTSSGAGVSAVTGLLWGYWQQVMFSTPGGQFLVIVNGLDGVRTYDATGGWVNRTASFVATTTPPGPTPPAASFINLHSHKHRLWFVEKDSMDLWYLPVDSVQGPCAKFPVGALFTAGGYVMAIGSYSVDAGDGMDDVFVIVTSEGQVALYAGTNPDAATDWSLIGVYSIGKPIGRRCLFDVGGDLLIINEDGVLPISRAIRIERAVAGEKSITANIRQAYVKATRQSRNTLGWEITSYPLRNMALLNVPGSGVVATEQFAYNTITGAWGRFTHQPALTWVAFGDNLYFGAIGAVYRAEYGATDYNLPIPIKILPAFSHLGRRGRLKSVKDIKLYISTDIVGLQLGVAVATDYTEPTTAIAGSNAPDDVFFQWDVTPWDGPTVWYGGEQVSNDWVGVGNIGTVVAPYISANIDASSAGAEFTFRWLATDFLYEPGGVLG